jgi:uncharacterized protein YqjF (DUF2071 family)
MPLPFLTARWCNLFLATYPVPPGVLEKRLPPDLELDTRDGQAFVSLVAFDFRDTRVLGVPWPGYRDFPELNLRFYARAGADRGVVFVREFVPSRLVAWLARVIYNEPYRATPLTSTCREDPESLAVEYRLHFQGRAHVLRATGRKPPVRPAEASVEHFFKEEHWGYGMTRRGQTTRYEVTHPVWEVYPLTSYAVDLDWAAVYGPEWAFLSGAEPCSTMLAAGSPIAVYAKGKLRAGAPTYTSAARSLSQA